uniref:ATP synthase B chain n=1 Tax=Mastocarpus papillatus TaxID=31436 RepID=A0A342RZ63_9FLOR|nr:ATP synthase B chain precursor [Mastocarpus papillatus]AOL58009.1 ATP synthase B chain precursor [Mastocarpus papillatus]
MFGFSFITLTSFVLIYQDIVLLNEETLILLCFVVFCWLTFTKLSESVSTDLTKRSLKTENSLKSSLTQLLKALICSTKLRDNFQNLSIDFTELKKHFLQLSSLIIDKLPLYSVLKSETLYPKKFKLIQNLEQQTTKLIVLLLSRRLSQVVSTQHFCKHVLQTPYFLCIHKISLREYLKELKNQ